MPTQLQHDHSKHACQFSKPSLNGKQWYIGSGQGRGQGRYQGKLLEDAAPNGSKDHLLPSLTVAGNGLQLEPEVCKLDLS